MKSASRALEKAAPKRKTLAADLLAEGKWNDALCALSHVYEQDGDLMRCRCCGRAIHVSYEEPLHHGITKASGINCPYQGDANPWTILLTAAAGRRAQNSATPA
ncbi:hypothetical protein FZ983_32300 [Azospirillum sp. B21]|uniref:hypothetical protein n=1 Tax=Azospirillum sp. B21 TaxID=2607496 RepID=UPI0011EDB52C|nr:hypothetical protein [Azospirillum sp. B21]KAA0572254.1 hypothetical protein FZ983_32300 [Azospirillum sp. B21]